MKAKIDFREIIMAYATGERVQSIADHFGIAKSYVTMLVDRHGAQYGVIKRQHQPKRVGIVNYGLAHAPHQAQPLPSVKGPVGGKFHSLIEKSLAKPQSL